MPESALSPRSAQARHAAAVRWGKENQAETARDLAAAKLEDYVRRTIASAPPLTVEQRTRIAALINSPRRNGGAGR